MKRVSLAALLCAALGCGGRSEIPTLELGGPDGAQLSGEAAKTPREAYTHAYDQLGRAHYNVQRNLDTRSQNVYAAREAMGRIVRALDTMRGCVAENNREAFTPAIERYAQWTQDIDRGTWGGSFLEDLERSEREIQAAFAPSAVRILAEFPPKPAEPTPAKEPAARPDAPPKPGVEPKAPASAPVDPTITARVLYRSWSRAYDEMIAAYKAKQDCRGKYQDLVESLRLLKNNSAGEKAAKLQIYIDYYADIDVKTKTFSVLPEKTSEKDILDELEVAARVIRKEFNPDK